MAPRSWWILAIFSYKKQQAWHWVAVGLLVDFCLRFYVSIVLVVVQGGWLDQEWGKGKRYCCWNGDSK